MKNNYRVDIFFRGIAHYQIEFPEFWLARHFAESIKAADGVTGVYLLQRMTDNSFDITHQFR